MRETAGRGFPDDRAFSGSGKKMDSLHSFTQRLSEKEQNKVFGEESKSKWAR